MSEEDYRAGYDIVYLKNGETHKLVPKHPETNPFHVVGALIAIADILPYALKARRSEAVDKISMPLLKLAADELSVSVEDLKGIVISRVTSRPLALVLVSATKVGTKHAIFEDTSPENMAEVVSGILRDLYGDNPKS